MPRHVLDAARLAGRGRGADAVGVRANGPARLGQRVGSLQLRPLRARARQARRRDREARGGEGDAVRGRGRETCSGGARRLRQLVLPLRTKPSERSAPRSAARRRGVGGAAADDALRPSRARPAVQQVPRLGAPARAARRRGVGGGPASAAAAADRCGWRPRRPASALSRRRAGSRAAAATAT